MGKIRINCPTENWLHMSTAQTGTGATCKLVWVYKIVGKITVYSEEFYTRYNIYSTEYVNSTIQLYYQTKTQLYKQMEWLIFQGVLHFLWKLNVYYCVHKNLSLVPI